VAAQSAQIIDLAAYRHRTAHPTAEAAHRADISAVPVMPVAFPMPMAFPAFWMIWVPVMLPPLGTWHDAM
jgi:hypothetical protein